MNILRIILTKFGKVFLVILATFRRTLCCFRRRRLSDSLPFTAQTVNHQNHRNGSGIEGGTMQNWNSWDDAESNIRSSSVTVNVDFNQIKQQSSQSLLTIGTTSGNRTNLGRFNRQQSGTEDEESNVDFFQDMVPEIRRPAKIIIRKHDEIRCTNDGFSGRLAVDPQLASGVGELGNWEENEGSWEDSMDISMDDGSINRESKLLDRERRAAENARRKQEKDAVRTSIRRDLLATKIS